MSDKRARVITYYALNIVFRFIVAIFIGLSEAFPKDSLSVLWAILLGLVVVATFIPSPFKDLSNKVVDVSVNIFTCWIVFSLFYIATEPNQIKSKEQFAKKYVIVYSCIMGTISLISLIFGI